jgi:hypothetical protein
MGGAVSEALARIKSEAQAEEKAAAPVAGDPAAPGAALIPPVNVDEVEIESWAQLPATFGSVLAIALPELREHYSAANCRAWGEAMHAVAKRHGWTFKDVGPYLGLAVATVPMAVPTVVTIRARRAARGDAPAAVAPGPVTGAQGDGPKAPRVAPVS